MLSKKKREEKEKKLRRSVVTTLKAVGTARAAFSADLSAEGRGVDPPKRVRVHRRDPGLLDGSAAKQAIHTLVAGFPRYSRVPEELQNPSLIRILPYTREEKRGLVEFSFFHL